MLSKVVEWVLTKYLEFKMWRLLRKNDNPDVPLTEDEFKTLQEYLKRRG